MSRIPIQYQYPVFSTSLKRDWEYYFILCVFLFFGFLFILVLALRDFELDLIDEPKRFARIEIGAPGPEGAAGGAPGPKPKIKAAVKKKAPGPKKTVRKAKKRAKPTVRRKVKPRKPTQEQLVNQSLVGVIASRSKKGNSALSKILQEKGIGSDVDRALKNVKKGSGGGGESKGVRQSKGGGGGTGKGVGVGGIGEVGTGYGGGGDNIDLGYKTSRAVKAQLTRGRASIEGSLDPSVIDRIVRQNLPGLKYCYEKELNHKPKLAGKIVVQFTIGMSGAVTQAKIESTSLRDGVVEDCIIRRVKRWRFPRPEGGNVIVAYPFVFTTT